MDFYRAPVLIPLQEDIERVEKILALLDREHDLATRADLAEELVHENSLLEDTNERALYSFLEKAGFRDSSISLRHSTEQLRSAMEPVFAAVHNTVPLDVHLHDPEKFEADLEHLCHEVRDHLAQEEVALRLVNAQIEPEMRERLRGRLRVARRHALGRPHPSHNPILRAIVRMMQRIDRTFPDTGAQYRPGRDRLSH